jgi:hypothetical protein
MTVRILGIAALIAAVVIATAPAHAQRRGNSTKDAQDDVKSFRDMEGTVLPSSPLPTGSVGTIDHDTIGCYTLESFKLIIELQRLHELVKGPGVTVKPVLDMFDECGGLKAGAPVTIKEREGEFDCLLSADNSSCLWTPGHNVRTRYRR